MEIRGSRLYLLMAITFVIIFLMNFIGNTEPDRLQRALMTATSGAVFLAIGLWLFRKFGKDKNNPEHFD